MTAGGGDREGWRRPETFLTLQLMIRSAGAGGRGCGTRTHLPGRCCGLGLATDCPNCRPPALQIHRPTCCPCPPLSAYFISSGGSLLYCPIGLIGFRIFIALIHFRGPNWLLLSTPRDHRVERMLFWINIIYSLQTPTMYSIVTGLTPTIYSIVTGLTMYCIVGVLKNNDVLKLFSTLLCLWTS